MISDHSMRLTTFTAGLLFVVPAFCSETTSASRVFEHAVVAADHPDASAAGAEILRQGGNVVDAAVATSFALSVTRPASCGIGGGGFMVIWNAHKQEAVALDYRERAPTAAKPDMYSGPTPASPEAASVRGGKAVAVPGNVAGLCYAAKHFGSLPLETLLQPAIQLAQNGFAADEHDVSVQASTLAKLQRYTNYENRYALLKQHFLNDGVPLKVGDRIKSPLLTTLKLIAKRGAPGFYDGDVANAIVRCVTADGGIITHADLRATQPIVRQPLSGEFRSSTILSMPPPSSGGVALLQTLNILQHWEQRSGQSLEALEHNSAQYTHVVTEAMKHAFADRAEFLGDADFVDVPVRRLTGNEYAAQIASAMDPDAVLPPEKYGRFFAASDAGTSHFSIIDRAGNAVACTETINLTFGSFVVVPEYGILLNDEMDDFAAQPGIPNAFGLMQSAANAIAPNKKPLSSMTPTIVVRDGKAVFASGASGGPRIISATIQATLNHLVFDQSPREAVSNPRFHHQWFPDELNLESPLFSSLGDALKARGHSIVRVSSLAANQSASRDASGLHGGSDPRKHGQPSGF